MSSDETTQPIATVPLGGTKADPPASKAPQGDVRQEYEAVRDRGFAELRDSRLETAASLLEEALGAARRIGDQDVEDRAYLNLCGVQITLETHGAALSKLRKLLMRSRDNVNCRLAAYNIARIYERQKEYKKGLFYARIARDRSSHLDSIDPEWKASDHNQIGNFLVAESRFEEALAEYRQAIAADPDAPAVRKAMILGNQGYCELVLGNHRRGFELLISSLRTFLHHGATRQTAVTHLDLAFGHLEIGRYRHARRHADRALVLAENLGIDELLNNSLYLLGEACHLCGDEPSARRHFERLQSAYAETPFLTDFLLAVDVRKMINLRA